MKPLRDLIFIKPLEPGDLTLNGIVIPDMAKSKPLSGTVIAAGPIVADVSVGDKVIYSRRVGSTAKVDRLTQYLVLREQDVLCVIA